MTKNCNHVFDVFIKTIRETKQIKLTTFESEALRTACSYCGPVENRAGISKKLFAEHSGQSRKQLIRSLRSLDAKGLIEYGETLGNTFGFRVNSLVMQTFIENGAGKVHLSGKYIRGKIETSRADIIKSGHTVPISEHLKNRDTQSHPGTHSPDLYVNRDTQSHHIELTTNCVTKRDFASQEKVKERKISGKEKTVSQQPTSTGNHDNLISSITVPQQTAFEAIKAAKECMGRRVVAINDESRSNGFISDSVRAPEIPAVCQNIPSSGNGLLK